MGIGVWQVILILVVVLIIFGAGKLPRVAGDLAKGIKNFKTGMKEEDSIESSTSSSTSDDGSQKDASPSVTKEAAVNAHQPQGATQKVSENDSTSKS